MSQVVLTVVRIFRRTHRKLERILREEVDEPRERQAREVVGEAEKAARHEPAEQLSTQRGRRQSGRPE
jgi:hypothetical protein